MDTLWWASGGAVMPGMEEDLWKAGTSALLALAVAVGYAGIAFNWHFQNKLARTADARAALHRLQAIVACSAVCGLVLMLTDIGWTVWRLYDVALAGLALHTWWFARRMRGLSLVHERLERAAELEKSAEQYREIAEYLPHAVWTADDDGRVDFSNERWRAYAGDGRAWTDAVHPDERDAVAAWWAAAVAGRRPVTREVRLGGAVEPGQYRTFLVSATPVVRGDAVKWFGACADVEDRKAVELEKERQAQQKAFFFNALSHDLRAPLNNVVLNAQLLKMDGHLDADTNESVDIVIENAMAAGDMVTKLLDFARAGAIEHNRLEPVDVTALLQQIERRFQPIAGAKGLYVRVVGAAADGTAEVTTDRMKLERIVSNLVDNAIKFTADGGITLNLEHRGNEGVAVRIADTGVGVPAEDAPHLFDEFYQVNNHERDRAKGFGMGLAICRSLARQLGGDVALIDTGPRGSCFEVTVPVRTDAITADGGAVVAAGREPGPGRGGRPVGAAGHPVDPFAARVCGV